MNPVEVLTLVVLLADGTPAADAVVVPIDGSGGSFAVVPEHYRRQPRVRFRTDAAGSVEIPRYSSENWKQVRRAARRERRGATCGTFSYHDPEVTDVLIWRADTGASVHSFAESITLPAPVTQVVEATNAEGCTLYSINRSEPGLRLVGFSETRDVGSTMELVRSHLPVERVSLGCQRDGSSFHEPYAYEAIDVDWGGSRTVHTTPAASLVSAGCGDRSIELRLPEPTTTFTVHGLIGDACSLQIHGRDAADQQVSFLGEISAGDTPLEITLQAP